MIRILRSRGPAPYNPQLVARGRTKLEAYYRLDEQARRQRKDPVEAEWRAIRADVTKALLNLFHKKCAYCETPLSGPLVLENDRFRPASGASNLSGEGSLDHYTWLALDWGNHYASCAPCNRAKRSFFPVDGPRAPVLTPIEQISSAENALLLDPCLDDPPLHLRFQADGGVSALSVRGETTIKVLNLNRSPLIEARAKVHQETIAALASPSAAAELQERGLNDLRRPHLAVIRAAFESWQDETRTLARAVPKEERSAERIIAEDAEAFRLTARPLRSVQIENFKIIRSLSLKFPEPKGDQAPWLMLLGENASGKSTALQAIGLALAGADEAERHLRPTKALTAGAPEGAIELRFWDHEVPVELTFRRGDRGYGGTRGPSAIVLGYGALRYPEPRRPRRGKSEPPPFSKISPLLGPVARIPHPGRWLAELDEHRFNVAARALHGILPMSDEMVMIRHHGRVAFRLGEDIAPLTDLSAGYQTVVGLSADIMKLLFERWDTLSSATAIVLVDEIDAHLHPRWKMRIVKSLREAFPLVQFVASTHDPLVLRGVKNGEVALLRRHPTYGAAADQDLPPVEGMQVDELLTSRIFGLESTLDPETEAKLNELYHLQSLPITPERSRRIMELRANIGDKESFGRNQRERLMLEAADQYLQSAANDGALEGGVNLRQTTISRLQSLIDRTARAPGGALG